jgi:hypothetical protein
MTRPGYEHLAGHPLAAGSAQVSAADDVELRSILGASTTGRQLHPLWGYIAAQTGINTSIEDLCGLADFSVDDGPMMGSIELEYHHPIEPDTEYEVQGEVVDLVRKHGSSGVFDLLTYRERLIGPDGQTVAVATNTFVLPRKDAS